MAASPQIMKPKGLADYAKLSAPATIKPAVAQTSTPGITPLPKGEYGERGITPLPKGEYGNIGITPLPEGENRDLGITPLPEGEGNRRDLGITPLPEGEGTRRDGGGVVGDWTDTRVPGEDGRPIQSGFTPRVNDPAPVSKPLPTESSVILPAGQSNPTMQTRTDAPAPNATAKAYEQWAAKKAAEVDDSVVNKLNQITSQDSLYMQQARTDGIRLANSRGLGNSSMAVGAAQDAMVRAATPLASQDASQAFQKNQQSRDYEYSLASQFAGQEFQGDQTALDRALDVKMQNASLNAADQQQINDIRSSEGVAAAERALNAIMQERDITFQGNESAMGRDLQTRLQNSSLDAADQQQIRDIASREGQAAADRALQEKLQNNEIGSQERQQQRDIEFQSGERQKDRDIQKWLAETNLDSSDRNAASQFITNMETMYQTSYQSIMANTALSAEQRTQQLEAAAKMRDQQLDFVRQMYDIELTWGMSPA